MVSGYSVSRTLDSVGQLRRFEEVEPAREAIDLTGLATSQTETLRDNDPGRKVAVSITEGLRAEGDPTMIEALLQHLIANAWAQTDGRDRPSVRVGVMQQNGRPAFYVKDNGPGTDQATAEALVGERPNNGATPPVDLGLAVARQVVEKHGGAVQVLTEDGVGTTVFFQI